MDIRFLALAAASFAPLHALDDHALRQRGIRRMLCDASPGMPCRVSLVDAQVGESVLLLNHIHHDVDSPYRSSGPIYVRGNAVDLAPSLATPPVLHTRLLSLRAYDGKGYLRDADAVDGAQLDTALHTILGRPKVEYVQIHFAKTGCYACEARAA